MTRRRPALLAASVGVALILAACQAGAASPSASPSATTAAVPGGSGELTSDLDLQVGDCFNVGGQESAQVEVVPCDEPHVYETFAVFDYEADADAAYAGEQALFEFADAECRTRFEAYVGVAYDVSDFFYTSVSPSAATWDRGDRENVCALHLQDKTPISGSAAGSQS